MEIEGFPGNQPSATLTREEVILILGVTAKTWATMVRRRKAPPPRGWDPSSGRRVWSAAEVFDWMAARPGPGNHERGRARLDPVVRRYEYSYGGHPARRPFTDAEVERNGRRRQEYERDKDERRARRRGPRQRFSRAKVEERLARLPGTR